MAATSGDTPAAAPPAYDLIGTIETMLQAGESDILGRVVARVERELITRALRHTNGHHSRASELLGINRTTLRNKLREFGIAFDRVLTDRTEPGD